MNDLIVSAFCLVFDNYVVVEFSKTGNASYLYERAVFDRAILPPSRTRPTLTQLKSKDVGRQLVHRPGWEDDFEEALANRGIRPAH